MHQDRELVCVHQKNMEETQYRWNQGPIGLLLHSILRSLNLDLNPSRSVRGTNGSKFRLLQALPLTRVVLETTMAHTKVLGLRHVDP